MARGEETGVSYLPPILAWEWQRHPGGTIRPVAAILFTGISVLSISAIEFTLLLQLYLILRIVNLLFEYGALIWLKIKEPNTPRPFAVPCGIAGAILLVAPTVVVSGFTMFVSETDALLAGGSVVVIVVCAWPLTLLAKYLVRHLYPPDKL